MSAHNPQQPAGAGSATAAPATREPGSPGQRCPEQGGPGQGGPKRAAIRPAPTGSTQAGRAALEALDALLDPRWYITVLITGDGRIPCLTVSSRYARLTWDIHADDGWFWSAEVKVAPFGDPGTTASVLAEMLDDTAT